MQIIDKINYGNNNYNLNHNFLSGNIITESYKENSNFLNHNIHPIFKQQNPFLIPSNFDANVIKDFYNFSSIKDDDVQIISEEEDSGANFNTLLNNTIHIQSYPPKENSSYKIIYYIAAEKNYDLNGSPASSIITSQNDKFNFTWRINTHLADQNLCFIQTKNIYAKDSFILSFRVYRLINTSVYIGSKNQNNLFFSTTNLYQCNNESTDDTIKLLNTTLDGQNLPTTDEGTLNGLSFNPIALHDSYDKPDTISINDNRKYLQIGMDETQQKSLLKIDNCDGSLKDPATNLAFPFKLIINVSEKLIYVITSLGEIDTNDYSTSLSSIFSSMNQHYIFYNGVDYINLNPLNSFVLSTNNIYTNIENKPNSLYLYDSIQNNWIEENNKNDYIYFTQSEIDSIFNPS